MKKQTAKTPLTKENLTDVLKKELSNYATKDDLKKELSNYATKADLKKELSNYPTKDYLNERLTAFQNAFRTEMRHEYSIMREELMSGMSKFTDLILTAIDPLLKELETRREDRELGTAQMEEVKTRVNNHEKRITKLEHS